MADTQERKMITPKEFVLSLMKRTDFPEKNHEERDLLKEIPGVRFEDLLEGIDQQYNPPLASIFFNYMAALASLDVLFQAKDPSVENMSSEQLFQFAGEMAIYFFLESDQGKLNPDIIKTFLDDIENHYEDFYNKFSAKISQMKDNFPIILKSRLDGQEDIPQDFWRDFIEGFQETMDKKAELTELKRQHALELLERLSISSKQSENQVNSGFTPEQLASLRIPPALFLPNYAAALFFSMDVYVKIEELVTKYDLVSKRGVIIHAIEASAPQIDHLLREIGTLLTYMNRYFFGLKKLVESRENILSKLSNKKSTS